MDTALGRGLLVLETLAAADGPMRLSNLAMQLGMQKSSTHRVLRILVDAGYVAQDPHTELYRATLRMWEFGSSVVNGLPIKQVATAVLRQLHRRTAETVSLSVLDGDDVLYLDKIPSTQPTSWPTPQVGHRVPAPLTASGLAMLAHEPRAEAVIERVARRGDTPLDPARALAGVRKARRNGYHIGRSTPRRGVVAIAMGIPGRGVRPAAALTLSAPVERLDADREQALIDALVTAGNGLREAIGVRYGE